MQRMKWILPVLALLALGFVLSGCPKGDKMMKNDTIQSTVEHIG